MARLTVFNRTRNAIVVCVCNKRTYIEANAVALFDTDNPDFETRRALARYGSMISITTKIMESDVKEKVEKAESQIKKALDNAKDKEPLEKTGEVVEEVKEVPTETNKVEPEEAVVAPKEDTELIKEEPVVEKKVEPVKTVKKSQSSKTVRRKSGLNIPGVR